MAGWPVPGVTVRVVDMNMDDVPRDMETMGEIVAMGDHIMEGYFHEPEATAAVMTGPWLHTGDMAVWDQDGYIQIVDRQAKRSSSAAARTFHRSRWRRPSIAHPAVLECAVVAAPDTKWGEVPAAIVILKPGERLTADDLLAFLGQRLGRFKLPRIVEFREETLPKTGTGKIRKMSLREKFWEGHERRVQG